MQHIVNEGDRSVVINVYPQRGMNVDELVRLIEQRQRERELARSRSSGLLGR